MVVDPDLGNPMEAWVEPEHQDTMVQGFTVKWSSILQNKKEGNFGQKFHFVESSNLSRETFRIFQSLQHFFMFFMDFLRISKVF